MISVLLALSAQAATPEVLTERTLGVGLEVELRGLRVGTQDADIGIDVITNTDLFQPGVSARFQLGRLALGPRLQMSHRTDRDAGEDESLRTTRGLVGLDARLYALNKGPLHLVGLGGVSVAMLQQNGPPGWSDGGRLRRLDGEGLLGLAVEWIPTAWFSLELNARLSVADLTIVQREIEPSELNESSWGIGFHRFSPSAAAHIWF